MANQPTYIDQALSGVANAWFNQQEDFIGGTLFPTVSVKKATFKIAQYGKENLMIPSNSLRTGDAKSKKVNYNRQFVDGPTLVEHSLSDDVYKDDYDQTDDPFEPESDAVENILSVMSLIDEKEVADLVTSTSNITQNTTLSGTDQWSDYANSDPIADIIAGMETANFFDYNTMVISRYNYNRLIVHPVIRDYLKWTQNGGVTYEALISVFAPFGIKKILIGKAKADFATEGQATRDIRRVWGNDVLLAYVTDRPARKTVNGGYKFQLANSREVTKEYFNNPPKTEIVVRDFYKNALLSTDAFYLLKNAFASS
jgi:hypothetical protein